MYSTETQIQRHLYAVRQNDRHFADDIVKRICMNENFWLWNTISLKYVPYCPTDNLAALVHVMAWCRIGDKALSKAMIIVLRKCIWVIRPQSFKEPSYHSNSIDKSFNQDFK